MTAKRRGSAGGRGDASAPGSHANGTTLEARAPAREPVDAERWSESEESGEERLDEAQLESLLTGIAGGHRADGDEGWLPEAEDSHWNTE